jgi:uncharacterized protein (DUF58 family)
MASTADSSLALDPALLQRLKGIELRSRFLVRGLYNNRHRTSDHGLSTEFIEHREYRRGDELRSIDWRVLARTERLYVKVHEMESNMRVHLAVDTSASMRVPPADGLPSKLDLACAIAGAVTVMVQGQQDAVGLVCLGDRIDEHIPTRQGPQHRRLLFEHLANPPGGGGGRLGDLLLEAAPRFGTRGMILLLSDALDPVEPLGRALRRLRAQQQDVTLIQILDRQELDFPFDRLTEFRHPETGARVVGDPAVLRTKYLARLSAHLQQVEEACQRAQADYLRLSNTDDLRSLLSLHFIRRQLTGGR